jgi:uncharacterized spore protein YtfJ
VTVQQPVGNGSIAEQLRQQNHDLVDKIYSAAQPGAVFSQPVESGPYTVITACEVITGVGFGFGSGTSPAKTAKADTRSNGPRMTEGGGGGGGGGSMSRPVAAIVIGPQGVKVEPIVDVTKLGLAGITTWAAIALMAIRLARSSKQSGRWPTLRSRLG